MLLAISNRDGRKEINFKEMDSDSAKALQELMRDPNVQAQFGIGPAGQHFDPVHCKRLYDAAGQVMQTVGRFGFHFEPEAVRLLAYSEQEKEELAGPTASALDELAPQWLRENQAVTTLIVVFAAITQRKLQEAASLNSELKARKQSQEGRSPGVTRVPIAARPNVTIPGNAPQP